MRTAASGSPAAAAPAAAKLERNGNKSFEPRVIAIGCRCKSRFCEGCAPALAGKTRDELLSVAHLMRVPDMLTLTVDPKRHQSARQALDFVRDGEYVRKLMDRLGIRRWAWTLEFQQNGWPHWHVLIDRSSLPRRRIDYLLARRLWRTWGIGEQLKFSEKKCESPRQGVMYITKYLTKPPRYGWPVWIRDMERAPRVVSMCQELSHAIRDLRGQTHRQRDSDGTCATRVPTGRTVGDRVAECCQSTMLVRETVSADGEVRREYLGIVKASLQDLAGCANRLGLRFRPDIVWYDDQPVVRWLIECPKVPTLHMGAVIRRRLWKTDIPAARTNRVAFRLALCRGEIDERWKPTAGAPMHVSP